jgi:pyruvate dehydrogenase E2 component (dihydrolipoamide acetyltransferase)
MGTFNLPDLGEGLAEAEILEWHVKPGDHVRVDQPMLSVETAKAVVEVPVPFNGTVIALHGAVGDIMATGAPLVDFDSGTVVGRMPETIEEEWIEPATSSPRRHPQPHARTRAVPLARALANRLGVDLSTIAGSGADGLIKLDDVLVHTAIGAPRSMPGAGLSSSPGGSSGTDANAGWSNGPGLPTGPGSLPIGPGVPGGPGRLPDPSGATNLDRPIGLDGATNVDGPTGSAGAAGVAAEPLRGARRAMAQSMSLSRDQVAGSTVCDDADIHGWTQRADYMLRLIRALIAACAAEPALNAWYDPALNARFLHERIDLAIAIDTAGGLIVPVLRDLRGKTPATIRTALAAQKDAAHRRTTLPSDLRDFTLLLSNFGTLAGRYGIPLVVPPAVAILGAGRVREDAVAVAGEVLAHRRMPLSLSFDHRCVTGGEACRFLAAVIADLEQAD